MGNKKKLRMLLIILGLILQSFGIATCYFNQPILSSIFILFSSILIISSLWIMTDKEKQIEKIEINDERNTIIRNMAHAKTNTIMVFIQGFIAVLCFLFNYHILAMIFTALIALHGLILCIIGYKIEKKM